MNIKHFIKTSDVGNFQNYPKIELLDKSPHIHHPFSIVSNICLYLFLSIPPPPPVLLEFLKQIPKQIPYYFTFKSLSQHNYFTLKILTPKKYFVLHRRPSSIGREQTFKHKDSKSHPGFYHWNITNIKISTCIFSESLKTYIKF